jgi:hypothetical protein
MFTDIMAAFGVGQNGCINLLYDIIEMRKEKEKEKQKMINERELGYIGENNDIRLKKYPINNNSIFGGNN